MLLYKVLLTILVAIGTWWFVDDIVKTIVVKLANGIRGLIDALKGD